MQLPSVQVTVELLHLTGEGCGASRWRTPLGNLSTPLPSVGETPATAAAFGLTWFCPTGDEVPAEGCGLRALLSQHSCNTTGSDCVINITVIDSRGTSDAPLAENVMALAAPKRLECAPTAVKAEVTGGGGSGGQITVRVTSDAAAACWVVLTTEAAGRFSENGIFVMPDRPQTVVFIPWRAEGEGGGEPRAGARAGASEAVADLLAATLRVEHLYPAMHVPVVAV